MSHQHFPAQKPTRHFFIQTALLAVSRKYQYQQHENHQLLAESMSESVLRGRKETADPQHENAEHAGPNEAYERPAIKQTEKNPYDGHTHRRQRGIRNFPDSERQ